MDENRYLIFIASSLRLVEHRRIISEVIAEVNASEEAIKESIKFDEFRYERWPFLTQKIEKQDAQAPVDRALKSSSVFFLIVDDVVRDLTQYEFELAVQRFKKGQMPQHISIFHCNGTALKGNDEGISYDELIKINNLNDYLYNVKGRAVTHKKVYDIPYDRLADGKLSLKNQVRNELFRLINSNELPYPGAVLGTQLKKHHFFGNDPLRLEKCPSVYYRRPVDDYLDQAIAMNKAVLLTGDSLSGKTRAVMEALTNVKDGWVYVFNKNVDDKKSESRQLAERIHSITNYLCRQDPPKLYIAIDDIGLLARSSNEVQQALEELLRTLLVAEHRGVLIATSTEPDVCVPGLSNDTSGVEVLHIPDLSEVDFEKAMHYFLSCGISVSRTSFRYKMMGALFVNLDDMRKRYRQYLEGGDIPQYLDRDTVGIRKLVRQNVLKSIKAQSIWREEFLGDLKILIKMTRYLLKGYIIDEDALTDAFNDAIEVLCEGGRMGISRGNGNTLEIQEYVYRYFVDYNGRLQKEKDDGQEEIAAEKKLICEILDFSDSPDFPINEPLTYQVSRLTTRCNYKAENVIWLYQMWSGTGCSDMDSRYSRFITSLQEDRNLCIGQMKSGEQSKLKHLYSRIIDNYVYQCGDFKMAWQAFEDCDPLMRTDHLLCAVMRQAKTDQERDIVLCSEEYKDLRDDAYVVRAEVEWASDFETVAKAIERLLTDEEPSLIAERLLDPTVMQYDIIQFTRAMDTLFSKVNNEDELNAAIGLVRHGFTKFIKDRSLLEKIRTNEIVVNEDSLTVIDLLVRINPYYLASCLKRVYDGDVDASLAFLQMLTDAVEDTLLGGFTAETEVRLLLSWIGSSLINTAAKSGSSFEELYYSLFVALQIPHPLHQGEMIIFRNSFAYTAMMECEDCDIIKAINLFENDLVRHAEDSKNPIVINLYTLNVLLKKCQDAKSSILERVDQLFTQLGVKRDAFSYYNLLRGGRKSDLSLKDCLKIVREMARSGVRHNVFTLTALMSCKEVNLSMALSFMDYPAGLLQGFIVKQFPEAIITPELKNLMGKYDEAWSCLFQKPCPSPEEKAVLGRCLEYLEHQENREILNSGRIYNALVGNRDFLSDMRQVVEFVSKKKRQGLFSPDGFTVSHLVERVCDEKDSYKKTALSWMNKFLMENPDLLNPIIINNRLRIYRSHNELLSQFFVEGSTLGTQQLSPIGYVEKMQQLHIPVDSYVIRNLTNNKKIKHITNRIYGRLMDVLVNQQSYYSYNEEDSEIIRERCGDYLPDYPLLKLKPISALSHNKNVTHGFRGGQYDINTALSLLDWRNENSAVTEFNTILSVYIDSFSHKTPELFDGIMGYYNCYFGPDGGHRPSSYNFGVMVKAVVTIDDFKRLFVEFKERQTKYPRLTLQPMMLTRLSAVVRTIDDLCKETRAYVNAGGIVNSEVADNYLYRIARYIAPNDPANAIPLLNDVFRYIILGGDPQQLLRDNEREYLLMYLYEDPEQVHAQTLYTIIRYNRRISDRLQPKQIVDAIAKKYSRCIPELINRLVKDKWAQNVYLPSLFWSLAPLSRPNLEPEALRFLAEKLIRRYNIDEYTRFMKHLYTTDCRNYLEAIVPTLVRCIHRFTTKDKELLDSLKRTEAQILMYAEIGSLRCGHVLIEKAPEEYVDWCRHSMDSVVVNNRLEENLDTIFKEDYDTADKKIRYYTNKLYDAYPCSLDILRLSKKNADDLDGATYECIKNQQHRFTVAMRRGEVAFGKMWTLPIKWVRAGWTPSVSLVLNMITAYVNYAVADNEFTEEVGRMVWGLTESVVNAENHHSEEVFVRYNLLGRLPEHIKSIVKIPIRKLAAKLYSPQLLFLAMMKKKGIKPTPRQMSGIKITERYFMEQLERIEEKVYYPTLIGLPARWYDAKYMPSADFALAMVQAYLRNPVKSAKNRNFQTALKIAEQKQKNTALLYYSSLGNCPEECKLYILVNTEKLKEILTTTPTPGKKKKKIKGNKDGFDGNNSCQ